MSDLEGGFSIVINRFEGLLGFEKTLPSARTTKSLAALRNQRRYSLVDINGNASGQQVMSEAEFIVHALQVGFSPQKCIERPCAKCREHYCKGVGACTKGKTVPYMVSGERSYSVTKKGHDFASYLIGASLTTFEAVQKQIESRHNEAKQKEEEAKHKKEEAKQIEEERPKAPEIELQALTDYMEWLKEMTANYGTSSSSEKEKILIQKEIYLHIVGSYDTRAAEFLVLIDNIDNPRCREDIITKLSPQNKALSKTFECITGIKLPKSYQKRKEQLETLSRADYGAIKQYKPRKRADGVKYNDTFYVLTVYRKFDEARGELWKYNDYDFFIQKHECGFYKATEGRSGVLVANECKTLEELKERVKNSVADSNFSTRISQIIDKYGVSPLYANESEEQ